MNFRYISQELAAKGLNNCHLEVLVPNNTNYRILAYQHQGDVEGDNQQHMYVRNVDRDLAEQKFNAFLSIAVVNDVELALTPEYSCPWNSIRHAIDNNIFPNTEKIWVLGCESITPAELRELINEKENDDLRFVYDNEVVSSQENKFLDPLCYFFKTTRIDNNSINLIAIICSDALGLTQQDLNNLDLHQSFLILHPQLNTNTRTYNFESYRLYLLFNEPDDSEKDILTLNWARNSTISNIAMNFGGSTFFMKSTKVNEEDTRINNNDFRGVFYTYWEQARVNTYFFDYDEYVFLLRTDKASKRLELIQNRMKRGPEIINRFKWNEDSDEWELFNTSTCDLTRCCTDLEQYNFESIVNLGDNSINKERLICLSIGHADREHWYEPKYNFNFLIDSRQVNNRMVFQHDPDNNAQLAKLEAIARFGEMVTTLVTDPDSFPEERFADLRNNCQLAYFLDLNNVHSYSINAQNGEGDTATLVYLGDCLENLVEEKLKLISNNFKGSLVFFIALFIV